MGNKKPRRGSIRRRILLLVLAFTVTAALIISANSVQAVGERLERTVLQSAEYTLQLASASIRANIQEVDALADWCSADPSTRTWLLTGSAPAALRQTVYTTVSGKYGSMRTLPYLQRFLCISAGGGRLNFGINSAQTRPLTEAALENLPGFGNEGDTAWQRIETDPLMLTNLATRGIPVTRTLRNAGATRTAHIYISVSESLITDPLKDFALIDGGALYWGMGGELYSVESGALKAAESDGFELTPYEAETLDPATRLFTTHNNGQTLVVCYPIGLHDLYLIETFPAATIYDQLPLLLRSVSIGLLIIAVLGVVLGALLQYMVARPVQALQRQIERLSSGDLTPDPGLEWNNELGDIGQGINRMADNISTLMEKRLEDEKQKQDLEYRMLQNQINPHFIYNTLNGIKWMATIQHADGIAEMTTALSNLLKSVSKGNEKLVPLEQELALLDDYFTIQQYRYGGTITLTIAPVEDKELLSRCLIPRFTLQPLVENAIFHGIEPSGRAGEITLTITREEPDNVLLCLQDNGVGMTPEQAAKALQEPGPEEAAAKFRHVGMWNVHRRLQYSFGDVYGLSIESSPGKGASVMIRLPGPNIQGEKP